MDVIIIELCCMAKFYYCIKMITIILVIGKQLYINRFAKYNKYIILLNNQKSSSCCPGAFEAIDFAP